MAAPVRIGVLGAGSIGIRGALIHLAVGDYTDRLTLAAVCDTVPGRAAAAAERFGVPEHFDDYDEMLRNGDIDAITVARFRWRTRTPLGLPVEPDVKIT